MSLNVSSTCSPMEGSFQGICGFDGAVCGSDPNQQCVRISQMCDGVAQCNNGWDEMSCNFVCDANTQLKCPSSGLCVDKTFGSCSECAQSQYARSATCLALAQAGTALPACKTQAVGETMDYLRPFCLSDMFKHVSFCIHLHLYYMWNSFIYTCFEDCVP